MITLHIPYSDLPFVYDSLRPLDSGGSGYTVQSGDIGFYLDPLPNRFYLEHVVLVGCDARWIIHSVHDIGVYTSSLNLRRIVVFFRFKGNPLVSKKAAAQAFHWSRGCHERPGDFKETAMQRVGYSSASFQAFRGINAALGFSVFGPMARRRLRKYKGRPNCAPKNVMCSELAILAYQLSALEKTEQGGFIKLDAKHSLPSILLKYLCKSQYWEAIGRGRMIGSI